MFNVICERCGEEFKAIGERRKFCDKCRKLRAKERNHAKWLLTRNQNSICKLCGKEFKRESNNQRHCCPEHALISKKKNEARYREASRMKYNHERKAEVKQVKCKYKTTKSNYNLGNHSTDRALLRYLKKCTKDELVVLANQCRFVISRHLLNLKTRGTISEKQASEIRNVLEKEGISY